MSTTHRTYLRSVRKRYGLTQADLAFLLALKQGSIAKLENRYHTISARLLVAYCIIFDCTFEDLMPDLVADIAKTTQANTTTLLGRTHRSTASRERREQALLDILKRSSTCHPSL